jgi:hypothetical protein
MKIIFKLAFALFVLCSVVFIPSSLVLAQDDVARAVVLGQTVEFTMDRGDEAADFQTISVRLGGRLLRQFAAPASFLRVVATFNGDDGDYLLLKTSEGPGVCAGGDLYALKFYTYGEGQPNQIGVEVSPVLRTCLGEYPPVKFTYDNRGLVISVSGHELRGEVWSRWVPERRPRTAGRRRQ